MRLYRGLNLDKSEIDFIRENGDFSLTTGAWLLKPKIDHHDLTIESVFEKILVEPDNIERYNRDSNDISDVGKYVTGCVLGASIYSYDSTTKTNNVLIEIDANPNQVFIDGRDFLYSAVPRLINNNSLDSNLIDKLTNAFGDKFLMYIENAKQLIGKDSNKIFRLVDYICMDNSVIASHLNNNMILIQGRYTTRFFSAFAVIGGIKSDMIIDIKNSDMINRQTSISALQSRYKFSGSISIYDDIK